MEGKDEEADPRRFSPLDFPSAARATFFDDDIECAKEDDRNQHRVELYDQQQNDFRQQAIFNNRTEGGIRNALHQERGSILMRDRLEFNISPPAIPRTATRRTNLFPLVEQQQVEGSGDHMDIPFSSAGMIPQPLYFDREQPFPSSSIGMTTRPRSDMATSSSSHEIIAPGNRGPPPNPEAHLPSTTPVDLASYGFTTYQPGSLAQGNDRNRAENVQHQFSTLTNSLGRSNAPTYATVGGTSSAFTSSRRSLQNQYPRQIPAYEAPRDIGSPTLTEDRQLSTRTTMPSSSSFMNISQPSSTFVSPFSSTDMSPPQLQPQNAPFVFTPVLVEGTAAAKDDLKFCLPVSTSDSIESVQHGITSLPSPSRNRPSSTVSITEESISSNTEIETIGRGRSIRQSRRSTRRGSRGRAPSPGRGRSSSSHLSGSRRKDRGRSTPSPASFASGNSAGEDDFQGEQGKSPPPQNLRGDPFRSAKVKTELCRNFNSPKGCPFGDKCNYAHGEHELKFTKLMDLERAGLVDLEIFRTHPCPTWVATGACPFDQRCLGLHDPRIKSRAHSSWLPHAETMINKVSNGVNVDSFYHERVASAYNLCPIYGYVPYLHGTNSSDDEMMNEASFKHFYEHVCNLERLKYQEETSFGGKALDEDLVLEIVLKLRENKAGISYRYMPTHMLRGELCMVLQTKTFESRKIHDKAMSYHRIHLDEVTEKLHASETKITVVHEIAFGPVGDPSARSVSVWFDLQESDLIECTPQQAKHHKRSRHRLKAAKRTKGAKFSNVADDDLCKGLVLPFEHYQPRDKCAFDLVTNILSLRLRTIYMLRDIATYNNFLSIQGSVSRSKEHDDNYYRISIQQLEKEIKDLNRSFTSQLRHWVTWSWPEQVLRNQIDDETDVPPVDTQYEFNVYKNECKRGDPNSLYGLGSVRSTFNLSYLSLHLPSLLWKSFTTYFKEQNDDSLPLSTPNTDGNSVIVNRLPMLQLLSTGREIHRTRTLPRLFPNASPSGVKEVDSFESFLSSWDATKKYFEEKVTSQNILKDES